MARPSAASASCSGRPSLGRDLGRELERLARGRVAGARLGGAEREQQRAAPAFVGEAEIGHRAERAAIGRDRVLVGQRLRRLLGGLHQVADRLALAVEVPAGEEVVRERGGGGSQPRPGLLERQRDPVVQPHAAARALALVEHLADERLREHEAVGVVRDLAHEPGRRRFLQRGDDPLDRLVDQLLEQLEAEVAADHRGDGEHLPGGVGQARQAIADQRLHPGRHRDPAQVGGVREAAQRLLDVERIALGPFLQPAHERVARARHLVRGDERLDLGGVEASQLDPLERARERAARPRAGCPRSASARARRRAGGARAAAPSTCRPTAGRRGSAPSGCRARRPRARG